MKMTSVARARGVRACSVCERVLSDPDSFTYGSPKCDECFEAAQILQHRKQRGLTEEQVRTTLRTCKRCETERTMLWFYPKSAYCAPCYRERLKERNALRTPEQRETDRQRSREYVKRTNGKAQRDWERRWRAANSSVVPSWTSDYTRYQKYGINPQEYDAMVEAQEGRCAICKTEATGLHVDHDHTSGRVRALLCQPCNNALGLVRENQGTLAAMIEYLRRHGADHA